VERQDMEEKFRNYLESYTRLKSIDLYAKALRLDKKVYQTVRKGIEFPNFYGVENIDLFLERFDRIRHIIPSQYDTNGNGDDNGNLSAALGKYRLFLQYLEVVKQMDLYDENPDDFDVNSNLHWYFEVEGRDNKYPIKPICKDIANKLKILKNNTFNTDSAKNQLKSIFKKNMEFYDSYNENEENVKTKMLNQILYGPSGTGKTYSTVGKALEILGASNKTDIKSIRKLKEEFSSQVEFVTFHQSFSYEDFVEGLKANSDNENITYGIENGVFKEICKNAKKNLKKPYVLIIDEINRGNISRIFGELITLIEPSKRAGTDEEISLKLPYSKNNFSVPDNLHIIGTMNTADRSLTMMDTALRRRFDFVEMLPNVDLVKGNFDGINVKEILKTINQRIEVLYDKEHLIGHSFLMNVDNIQELKSAFKNKILPLLEEYFYDDFKKINLVLGSNSFYTKETKTLGEFSKDIYQKQDTEELDSEAFINIYAT
jgi:hypothetical protein